MDIAKKSLSILSYDVNLKLPLWSSPDAARVGIMSVWDQADVITVNEDEVKFLTNDAYDDNVVMKKLFHPNLKLLLVTQGERGCRYYTKARFFCVILIKRFLATQDSIMKFNKMRFLMFCSD